MREATGPARFARRVMATAAPDALILAQWSLADVLEDAQTVESQRPDLEIVNRSRLGVAGYYTLW